MKAVLIAMTATLILVATIALQASPAAKKTSSKKGAEQTAKSSTAAPSATLIARGHTLFLTNCGPCHGADAQGDDGPNLHHRNLPDSAIASAVTKGFQGEMPAFGGKLKAPDQQAVVAYVHSLQK